MTLALFWMQAAAAHKVEQQRLEEEVSRLRGDKASLLNQAQRVPDLEEQLKATSLANAEASQVGQHTQHVLDSCLAALSFALLFCLFFYTVHFATPPYCCPKAMWFVHSSLSSDVGSAAFCSWIETDLAAVVIQCSVWPCVWNAVWVHPNAEAVILPCPHSICHSCTSYY